MRSGRSNFLNFLLLLASVVGGAWLWRFGPYYWDKQEMDGVVKGAARSWKDMGEGYARNRLSEDMYNRDLPTYLKEEMCRFDEVGAQKIITCEWVVQVAWPVIGKEQTLHFVSTATVNSAGFVD